MNPQGGPTTYDFQYGTTTGYSSQTLARSAGSGVATVAASVAITGLTPSTTYHYRLTAADAPAAVAGVERSLKTLATPVRPPAVAPEALMAVASSTATVAGTVDPKGARTAYSFQYRPSTAYGLPNGVALRRRGDGGAHGVLGDRGLWPGTLYHYRLTTTDGAATVVGADRTFATPGAVRAGRLAVAVSPGGGDADLAASSRWVTTPHERSSAGRE